MPVTTESCRPKGSASSSSSGWPTPAATATAFMPSCAASAWPITSRTPKRCGWPSSGPAPWPASLRAKSASSELETDEQLEPSAPNWKPWPPCTPRARRRAPLALTSGTAQLGHLGGASGMAALIKASLEIEHGQTAPDRRARASPPRCSTPGNTPSRPVPGRTKLTGRRLVGVSCWSRGLACHLILEHAAAGGSSSRQRPKRSPLARPPAKPSGLPPRKTDRRAGHGRDRSRSRVWPARQRHAAHRLGHDSRWQVEPAGPRIRAGAPRRPTPPLLSRYAAQVANPPAGGRHIGRVDRRAIDRGVGRSGSRPGRPIGRFAPADKFRLAIVADSAETLADQAPPGPAAAGQPGRSQRAGATGHFLPPDCRPSGRRWRWSFRARARNTPACCGRWSKTCRPPPRPWAKSTR